MYTTPKMNRFRYVLVFIVCFLCVFEQVESRPLDLAKTASKLLSILGTGTYYDVSAGTGSCGQLNSDSDMVVAVSYKQMKNGANPNKNPRCNKKVKIIGKTGKPITATVVDTCPGCESGCLDMSSACKFYMISSFNMYI